MPRYSTLPPSYFPNAKFLVHTAVDMPERLMREVLRASGGRTRFTVYEMVAKLFDAPIKAGVVPTRNPSARLPADAARASLALRQAAEKKMAEKKEERRKRRAESGGGEDDDDVDDADDIDLETARALIAAEVPLMEVRVCMCLDAGVSRAKAPRCGLLACGSPVRGWK